jgi:hypothetical protein
MSSFYCVDNMAFWIETLNASWRILSQNSNGSIGLRIISTDRLNAAALVALNHLTALNLEGSCVDDLLLSKIAKLNLKCIVLRNNVSVKAISDEGARHLSSIQTLTILSLRGSDVSDRGLKHLSLLPNLEYLDLSDTRVTDKGMRGLRPCASCPHTNLESSGAMITYSFRKLSWLRLEQSQVTFGGMEHLGSLPALNGIMWSPVLTASKMLPQSHQKGSAIQHLQFLTKNHNDSSEPGSGTYQRLLTAVENGSNFPEPGRLIRDLLDGGGLICLNGSGQLRTATFQVLMLPKKVKFSFVTL